MKYFRQYTLGELSFENKHSSTSMTHFHCPHNTVPQQAWSPLLEDVKRVDEVVQVYLYLLYLLSCSYHTQHHHYLYALHHHFLNSVFSHIRISGHKFGTNSSRCILVILECDWMVILECDWMVSLECDWGHLRVNMMI